MILALKIALFLIFLSPWWLEAVALVWFIWWVMRDEPAE